MNFAHVRMYSEYSIEKSINKIDEIINKYINDDQKCAFLTDVNNLFASVNFYEKCYKKRIKPILGCEILIENKKDIKNPFKILLLIKNKLGFLNLSKILSKGSIYNNYKSKNNQFFIKKNWLKTSLNKGLILLSGDKNGEITYNLYKNNINLSIKSIKFWNKYFKNRFYLEIQKSYYNKKNIYKKIIYLSNKFKLPIIATHNVYFLNKNEFLINKIKTCIYKNIKYKDYKPDFVKDNFFIPKKQMMNIFKNIPSSLTNTIELTKKCNLILDLKKIKLPFFKTKKINNNSYLLKISLKKLKEFIYKNYINDFDNKYKIYKDRLLKECKIIISMGLTDYFLIVNDFVNWGKKQKILIGPGRGSGAGSLVAFLLNITSLDPIKYNLLFERFLNQERVSMPDFDIDFPQNNREKIINYVKYKYGVANVVQIVTFGKLAAKASIRDIGRILNFNYNFIDKLIKLIPFKINTNLKIKDIIKNNLPIKLRYKNENNVKTILNLSSKLENRIKNLGSHAGGILISHNKIFNICPIIYQHNSLLSSFHKDDSELIGLLKFDFLVLITLDIISKTIYSLKNNLIRNKTLINLKDKLCFLNLKKANTDSIFQLESKGMKNIIIKSNPDCFDNIITLISLYRPGPMELLDDFCLRKLCKKKVTYLDPKLKNILLETYGIIVYQEQVMEIVKIIGNFSLNKADILRRAISKKNSSEIKNLKSLFLEGAKKNNINEEKSEKIFKLIEKFAGYGFNKSHATAYSLISYYTIWFKTYYINNFLCSNLSYLLNDLKRVENLIRDSLMNNMYILPVNINKSNYDFLNIEEKLIKIRYGLGSIKGLGKKVVNEILKIRKNKHFKSFEDFYIRSNKNIINNRIIEILILSGSFDIFCNNRAKIFENFIKIKDSINLRNKRFFNNYIINNFNDKKLKKIPNVFWNFRNKSLKEFKILGNFLFNNLYNLYKIKVEELIFKKYIKNDNILYGILIDIIEKSNINYSFFSLLLLNNFDKIEFKISNEIYNKYKNFIRIYDFLLIFKKKIKILKIINLENFIKFYVKNKVILEK